MGTSAVAAILVAAGSGSRFAQEGDTRPKQFLELAFRPLYMWPLMALQQHPQIERVVLVTLASMVSAVEEEIAQAQLSAKTLVTAGGKTRQESVWRGLEKLASIEPQPSHVLVHDAARPFLLRKILFDTVEAVLKHGAVTTCIPAQDTIKRVEDGVVIETLDRSAIVQVQTPQGARFDWLYEAHIKARAKGLLANDDATLLEAVGYKVTVVPGSPHNVKITRPEDLKLAEALIGFVFCEPEHCQ